MLLGLARIDKASVQPVTELTFFLRIYLADFPYPKIATASQTEALLCTPLIKFLELLHLLQQRLLSRAQSSDR